MRSTHLSALALTGVLALSACSGADVTEADLDTTETERMDPQGTASPDVPDPEVGRPVVVAFDGLVAPLDEVCAGADGAIRATTEDGTVVTLVREDGTAIRYDGDDVSVEIDDVVVDEGPKETVYSGGLRDGEADVRAITITVLGAEGQLVPDC